MKFTTLRELFIAELKDTYDAEDQITQALPKMVKAASAPELQTAFQQHLEQTQQQIERLEQVFSICGEKAERKLCKGMQGILKEGDEMMKSGEPSAVMDAALISAAQKVEHYEIASYGTLRTFANQLGMSDVAKLLQTTLDEEGKTDEKLTKLAERMVNPDAKREAGR